MLCLNAPLKPMARIHVLVSLLLVIVCTVLAFMPLTKIVVTDETVDSIHNLFEYVASQGSGEDVEERNAAIEKVINSMDLENASVGISVLAIKDSAKPLSNIAKLIGEMIQSKNDDSKMEEIAEKLKNEFINEDGEIRPEIKDFAIIMAALAGPMIPDDPSTMNNDKVGEMIAAGIPSMIGVLFALILSFILPIVFIILFLVTLIGALTSLKDPVIGAAKLAKRLPKISVHAATVLLAACLSATVEPTLNAYLMLGAAGLGTLFNVLFTRLHTWEKKELRYANVVQAVSLFSIGAYVFFFLNLLKMGVFKSFLAKALPFFIKGDGMGLNVYIDTGYIVIAVFFALISSKYLAKVLRRISLACSPKRKGGAHCTHLVYSLFLFTVPVLPMMALGSTANNGRSFLALSTSQEYALLYGFIAVALMVLTEIVLLILRKIAGKGLTKAQIADIMTNVSLTTNDTAAAATEGAGEESGAAEKTESASEEVKETASAEGDPFAGIAPEEESATAKESATAEEAATESEAAEAPAAEEADKE